MSFVKKRAIFLDRDGVINHTLVEDGKPIAPRTLDDIHILPGVERAVRDLKGLGFKIIVVTNQPDVAKGTLSRHTVEAMHRVIARTVEVDDFKVCYHVDEDGCSCRKPQAGMLLEAAEDWSLDLRQSYVVGDRWRDIEAGKRAGCKTILIESGYEERQAQNPDKRVNSLREASHWILNDPLARIKTKIFADGADLKVVTEMAQNPLIRGFTTNPTLMRKSCVSDYRKFAEEMIRIVSDRPISFEVFSDDFDEMEAQAYEIASWGKHVYVKIPVTNTRGEFSGPLIKRLTSGKVQVNVTALMTLKQVQSVMPCLSKETKSYVSLFAGRVADTGRDPLIVMREAVKVLSANPEAELIWASPRELLNIFQADQIGCQIITATRDILNKLSLAGKNLDDFSLETVQMFYRDAREAAYRIDIGSRV